MYFRRTALAFALSALAAAGVPAVAKAAQGASPSGPNRVGVLVGVEDEAGPSGLQLRGDLEFTQRRLSPAVGFSIVGSLGYTRFHDDVTDFFTGESWEASTHVLRLAPAARFSFGAHPTFRPYVDAGLGLYWASTTVEYTDLAFGFQSSVSDSEVSVFMRFAAGMTFQVSPGFALGAEVGFLPYFGDLDATTSSLLASAIFRM